MHSTPAHQEICTGTHRRRGALEPPVRSDTLDRATPIYQTRDGWKESTSAARSYDELPVKARKYLDRIPALMGVDINYVSVGTKREQIIEV
jgi:adenylosuccinate synthase